jgi:DNA modification methylase
MIHHDEHLSIYQGDWVEVLRTLPDESVHCVVTSPPYWGLRDYGTPGQLGLEPTPDAYVAAMVAGFREVRRVLRQDGTCWVNLGDSYGGGASGGSVFDNGRTDGRPSYEGDKPRGRRQTQSGLKPKDLVGIPWRVAFALQADGWYLRSDIIWSKPNPMPESVTDRPTKAHEYVFLLTKNARYFYDAEAVREPAEYGRQEGRSAWVSGGENGDGHRSGGNGASVRNPESGRNLRSVWQIATEPYPGAHFATFPQKLVEPCIKAGAPLDGVVLDPFAGSGTTGLVANRLGRRAILIDLSTDYLDQALTRNQQKPLGLLG